jgi:hypothetical protein
MKTICLIVEGEGEVKALPKLLYKLRQDFRLSDPIIQSPGRDGLTTQLENFLELTDRRPECQGVLVLLDTDRDACPRDLAYSLAERAKKRQLRFPVAIVCANSEYETWFLASMETIASQFDIPAGTRYEGDVEAIRDAKGWIRQQMPANQKYKADHQASMTALLDPDLVRPRSRSFRRLEHALEQLLTLTEPAVTPPPEQSKS